VGLLDLQYLFPFYGGNFSQLDYNWQEVFPSKGKVIPTINPWPAG
jgi:hypothetical protein